MPIESFNTTDSVGVRTTKRRSVLDDVRPFCTTKEVLVEIRDKHGRLKSRIVTNFETKGGPPNLRVNGGADFWNTQLFSTGAAVAQANYIAMTTDATAPAATDTTLTSEETTNGLARAQGTVAHTTAATVTTISHTFTYTGSTSKVIAKVGLFNASSSGTMVLETLLSSTGTVNANGDTITITWTINF